MLEKLKALLEAIKALRRDVQKHSGSRIARKELRLRAEALGTNWFSEVRPNLDESAVIPTETLDRYGASFALLIKLSAPNNLRTRYLTALTALSKRFRDELVIPFQQAKAGSSHSLAVLGQVLGNLPRAEENDYLDEAIKCAKHGYFRAAVVLGWCAAINRIHLKIESAGFPAFNVTSAQMASQQKGRFKKFSAIQNVNSISELREVFDNVILWIVEGMGLIDSNQHTRLRSCFDMRCQCAHPGEAPITEYNLMSFFSDLNEIVLKNSKFTL
jgi:hypothetical protein